MWFSEEGAGEVGRIGPHGAIHQFHLPTAGAQPQQRRAARRRSRAGRNYNGKYNDIANAVAVGPDGNLWWTAFESNAIWATDLRGRIVHVYSVPTPDSQPWGIVNGRDGALWFTEWGGNKVGRVTTSGAFTEYLLPTPNAKPQGIARSSDGSIWFVESGADRIGRIVP